MGRPVSHARGLLLLTAIVVLSLVLLYGCAAGASTSDIQTVVPGGSASNGNSLIRSYGCSSCHAVPGVKGADGKVGPPLTDFRDRKFIAGKLPNTPDNLMRWIQHPQEVEPGVAMPDMNVTDQDAQDIVAYLYTLH